MNGLDLFSGIGGLSLALKPWVQTAAYCENNKYAQSVLLSRMFDGQIDVAPIWDDVTTLKGEMLPRIEIICAGFPCQDISVAGLGKGLGGERSGLFHHIARLIEETNPRFVFLENVPAIRTRGLNSVVQTLTELGYDSRWTIVSAAEIGAVHIRKRWFLLAHANSERLRQEQWQEFTESEGSLESNSPCSPRDFALPSPGEVKSLMVRSGDGIPSIMDRARALGNSVVPAQAREAFEKLRGIK